MADLAILPGVFKLRACVVITYLIENSGQTLILTDAVIDHLNSIASPVLAVERLAVNSLHVLKATLSGLKERPDLVRLIAAV